MHQTRKIEKNLTQHLSGTYKLQPAIIVPICQTKHLI